MFNEQLMQLFVIMQLFFIMLKSSLGERAHCRQVHCRLAVLGFDKDSCSDLMESAACWPLMSTRELPTSRSTLKEVAVPLT